MERLWLAIAALVALGGSARADVAQCECPSAMIIPASGATGVPSNTKAWVFGRSDESFRLSDGSRDWSVGGRDAGSLGWPVESLVLRDVEPDHQYQLTGDGIATSFTTGHLADNTPPAQPEIATMSISVVSEPGERAAVASLVLATRYDSDAAVLEVTIQDAVGIVSFVVPANHQFFCDPGIGLAPGNASVRIVAIDLAGNYSMPTTTSVDVVVDPNANPSSCEHYHRRNCGLGETALVVFGGMVVVGLLLALLVISAIRHALRSRTLGEPVSLLIAEHAARTTLRRAVVAAAIELCAMSALFAIHHEVVACGVALFAARDLIASWSIRRFIVTLECVGATAELRTRAFVVHLEARERWLRVSRRAIAAARRAAVPAAEQR